MITVNFTLLVQLANFLILLVILNHFLFKPVLRVLDERAKLVSESAELKEKLGQLTAESIGEYESRLLKAKQEAMGIRTSGRNAAMEDFRRKVQEARGAGEQHLDKARKEITAEAGRSRESLAAEARTLADGIAAKLLGRKM